MTLGIVLCASLLGPASSAADDAAVVRDVLDRTCVACHDPYETSGGLDLEPLIELELADLARAAREAPADWRYYAERVRLGEMPPEDATRTLTPEQRAEFVQAVESLVAARYDPTLTPDPIAPVARRLTRAEVDRTIRDALGVDVRAADHLPAESVALGFDNVGSAQTLSPTAVEGLLAFAEEVADQAIQWDDPDADRRQRVGGPEFDAELGERLTSRRTVGGRHAFPRAGRYRVRVALSADQAGPELAKARLHLADTVTHDFEVRAEAPGEPQISQLEFGVLGAAQHPVEVEFINDYYQPDDPDPSQRDRNLIVHWIEVEGPLDPAPETAFQRELFAEFGPELGRDRLERVIGELCLRLWRRPADPRDVRALERLTDRDRPFPERVRVALEAILASPRFHYRLEFDPVGAAGVRDLDDFELATRLSFLVWSAGPDRDLLAAAARGELSTDLGLRAQLERMLDDPRASALAENFAPQWLSLTRLDEFESDGLESSLLLSMRRETELLFDAVLRERRPALELLDARFTFVDDALAEHYGLPTTGSAFFRRVPLGRSARRGVLGHASVLTATSDPGRTSPVLRGKWILDSLLGSPPPAPPDDVPALEASGPTAAPDDLRAALAQHRADPACASCHASIDPLGFALEGFDAVGRRRGVAATLDLSAELPDGTRFEGLGGLVEVLRGDQRFLRTLLERLYVYALGRSLGDADRGQVARDLIGLDLESARLTDLLEAVVLSPAFRQRRTIDSTESGG